MAQPRVACALILAIRLEGNSMNQTSDFSRTAQLVENEGPRFEQHRLALICAAWHADLVAKCKEGFLAELERHACDRNGVDVWEVPGAFEIPLRASRLARTGRYDAIVACALVVNGGIYRHEFVAATVVDELMRVQLDSDVPVFSAVLTPRDFHEHEDHRRFFAEHLIGKGREVARACLSTLAEFSVPNAAGR